MELFCNVRECRHPKAPVSGGLRRLRENWFDFNLMEERHGIRRSPNPCVKIFLV
jgi:hypothetical protein